MRGRGLHSRSARLAVALESSARSPYRGLVLRWVSVTPNDC